MKRLIELLNEFEKEKWNNSAHGQNERATRREWDAGNNGCRVYGTLMSERESRLTIISKGYGFIKRLADNDKLNILSLDARIALSTFTSYERVLMALAISDNPIDLLIELIK